MDLIFVTLATAFVVSTIDYFRYLGFYRVPIALLTAGLAAPGIGMSLTPASEAVVAAAGAFAALSLISIVDRIVSLPVSVRGR